MNETTAWSAGDIPNQSGKIAIVTGANSGLGFHTSLELARKGAHVILACRNDARAEAAIGRIRREVPAASVEKASLDVSDLASVRAFADHFLASERPLALLANNAGLMAIPQRMETVDGFEMQFGTNHLGHFALTARLMPALLKVAGARVLSVSSVAHRMGEIHFDDLQWRHGYKAWPAYGQSKLANLLFTFELQQRANAAHASLLAVAAHPGFAATNLQATGAAMGKPGLLSRITNRIMPLGLAQSDAEGALPSLYALTSPFAIAGAYYGPSGFMEIKGSPKRVSCLPKGRDPEVARRLWTVSEQLTGVTFPALSSPRSDVGRAPHAPT